MMALTEVWRCTWPFVGFCVVFFLSYSQGSELPGFVKYHDVAGSSYTVTYDERSFFINNKRTMILSGSVHYPRSTPGMWDKIFAEMIKDGLNAVEVYVFWNIHQPKSELDEFNFSGPANLPLFLEKAAKAGLFVNLRIGPYVCAEWNYGGFPVWMNFVTDPIISSEAVKLRSSQKLYLNYMYRFVCQIVNHTEKYLARNGGPVILAQIENEYHWPEYMDYVNWCGNLVAQLDLGIPWVMCNGLSANNTINTCNGNDCQKYADNHAKKYPSGQPLAWTEDEGWFQEWSVSYNGWADRTPEDMANVILAWFARGGSHHNYYMWYGGNHMGRWAASGIANQYADGANMHSDLLPNEPKRTHLMRVHKLIAENSAILLSSKTQVHNPLYLQCYNNTSGKFENGTMQMAFIYDNSVGKIIFLQNTASVGVTVKYYNLQFAMQSLSVIALDKSNSILFDSSKVDSVGLRTRRAYTQHGISMEPFVAWSEDVRTAIKGTMNSSEYPLEQLWITRDTTDYLFYQTEVGVPVVSGSYVVVDSRKANSLLVFIDGQFQGATDNYDHAAGNISMAVGITSPTKPPFNLTILSVSLGLDNGVYPGFLEKKGIVGSVFIDEIDITTSARWFHQPKLTGELLHLYADSGCKNVTWNSDISNYNNVPLTWYKTSFFVKEYSTGYSLLLNLQGFGRGHYYVNGVDLGRYWLITVIGQFVQEYYFIPPDVVKYDDRNLLVIGEELGAPDPSNAKLVLSTMVV